MSTAGLLLAAGRGRRSGLATSKLLLPHQGRPLVLHAAESWLAAGFERVVLVLGFASEELSGVLPAGLEVVENPGWEEGMASSIRAGMRHIGEDHVLLGFADMPWVDARLLRRLAAEPGDDIVAPTCRGRRGHPVRFPARLFPELLALEGDRGAFRLLERYPVREVEVGTDVILRDVDRPADILPRVVLRGGGDLATGVAHRLAVSGFPVAILELPEPRMIRGSVAFGTAVYDGAVEIEGVRAERRDQPEFGETISVVVDPEGRFIERAEVLVDARMLKEPAGASRDQASLVIGLGPGLVAGEHVHYVVETQRGHLLGRVIATGSALEDTGVPGELGGESWRRVVRSPGAGLFEAVAQLGQEVTAGEVVARVAGEPVLAQLAGTVRGMLRSGLLVETGEKLADVDPRSGVGIHGISDKARAVGGGVLEAILRWRFGR